MTECIFHDVPDQRQRDFCLVDVVNQACGAKKRVLVYTSARPRAEVLDRLLWILREDSFIPHRIWVDDAAATDTITPVGIVFTEINPVSAGVLIADGPCGLDFAGGFAEVHEFVDHSSAQRLEDCRQRFRQWRQLNVTPRYLKK